MVLNHFKTAVHELLVPLFCNGLEEIEPNHRHLTPNDLRCLALMDFLLGILRRFLKS
jgi:hypothetical protein